MTYETAILVATRALFFVATAERRRPAWIGPDDDIETALALLLPSLLAEAPPCFSPTPEAAALAGVSPREITGCASAGPEPGDPRQLKLPVTEASTPPRAAGFPHSEFIDGPAEPAPVDLGALDAVSPAALDPSRGAARRRKKPRKAPSTTL